MIELLHIDEGQYPYGFLAECIKSEESGILNKTCRANFYQIFWVKKGEVILHIDTTTITVEEGECGFIGINQVFRGETPTFFEVLVVRFTDAFYCRHDIDTRFLASCVFFNNSGNIYKFRLYDYLEKTLLQYYQALHYICKRPYDPLMYHFAHNTIERILLFSQKELISPDYGPIAFIEKTDNDIGNNFRQLVKDSYKDQKQVKFYADKLYISVKRLSEICNSSFGQSPKKIIVNQIMLEAKRLLQHSSANVKEIAYELKFNEPSNFIRFFAKNAGMPPREYREQFKIKERIH